MAPQDQQNKMTAANSEKSATVSEASQDQRQSQQSTSTSSSQSQQVPQQILVSSSTQQMDGSNVATSAPATNVASISGAILTQSAASALSVSSSTSHQEVAPVSITTTVIPASSNQAQTTTQIIPMPVSQNLPAQSLAGTPIMASAASSSNAMQHVQIQQHQQAQAGQILQTSVQQGQTLGVSVSQLPQVQVFQQPTVANGPYLQQIYTPQMFLPGGLGNLTLQPLGATNSQLSLQLPFSTATAGATAVPITSNASKQPPIMSKGLAISPMPAQAGHGHTHHMISPLKPNITTATQPLLKPMLPAQQQLMSSPSNQTVVISQFGTVLPQQSHQQSILPATGRTLDAHKGKPFAVPRSYGVPKMLQHGGTTSIQPKSLLHSQPISSASIITNPQFKTHFGSPTQLIQGPTGLIANQSQIFSSFQQIPVFAPQTTHLVAQNGSPILIRGQGTDQMFIQTSTTPQLQTMSMGTPISVCSTASSVQVTAAQSTFTSAMQPTIATVISTSSTTTPVTTLTQTPITSTPSLPTIKPKPLRGVASSVGTQTAASTSAVVKQADTTPKLIAPAKPKSNQSKASLSVQTSMPTAATRPISGSAQTVQAQTTSAACTGKNLSEAGNQTNKVSVGTETVKANNALTNKPLTSHDAQKVTAAAKSQSSDSHKTKMEEAHATVNKASVKRVVEKKDASTEQDSELLASYYAQQQSKLQKQIHQKHQSQQISTQTPPSTATQNGHGPILSESNRCDNLKQPPQKAIVKPQILTHVIDGYIIQESPDPFPVNGVAFTNDRESFVDANIKTEDVSDKVPSKLVVKPKSENGINATSMPKVRPDTKVCEGCGKERPKKNFKKAKSKRYCSANCAKDAKARSANKRSAQQLFNPVVENAETSDVNDKTSDLLSQGNSQSWSETNDQDDNRKRMKLSKKANQESGHQVRPGDQSHSKNHLNNSTEGSGKEAAVTAPEVTETSASIADDSSSSIAGVYIPSGGRNPLKWSVQDVYDFVRNLQGCTEYADEFRSQEIDGQALMLLKEDHLMSAMNMKLGPALKICNKINALREDVQKQS